MKKQIVIFILSLTIITSCNNSDKNSLGEDCISIEQIEVINQEYIQMKSFFRNDFVNHFPKKLNDKYLTFTGAISHEAELLKLKLFNKIGDNNRISEKYQAEAIGVYYAGDSCLLVSNRFSNTENYSFNIELTSKDSLLINSRCFEGKYPIPNFWHNDYTTEETECKLPSDFVLYVLEAQSGKFLEDKYMTDGKYMPEAWRNGYSKGVAISEKRNVIIYWTIIW